MIRLQVLDIRYQTLYVRYKDRIDKGETIFHMGYSVIIQIKTGCFQRKQPVFIIRIRVFTGL